MYLGVSIEIRHKEEMDVNRARNKKDEVLKVRSGFLKELQIQLLGLVIMLKILNSSVCWELIPKLFPFTNVLYASTSS